MKSAFPGARWSLALRIWINCPTDMSLGTRYLHKQNENSFNKPWIYGNNMDGAIFRNHMKKKTYFFFSISGRSVLIYLSTTTCNRDMMHHVCLKEKGLWNCRIWLSLRLIKVPYYKRPRPQRQVINSSARYFLCVKNHTMDKLSSHFSLFPTSQSLPFFLNFLNLKCFHFPISNIK